MENPKCQICNNSCELLRSLHTLNTITCYRCSDHGHYYQVNYEHGKIFYICMTIDNNIVHFDYCYEMVCVGDDEEYGSFWIDPQKYNYVELKNKVNAYLLLG